MSLKHAWNWNIILVHPKGEIYTLLSNVLEIKTHSKEMQGLTQYKVFVALSLVQKVSNEWSFQPPLPLQHLF